MHYGLTLTLTTARVDCVYPVVLPRPVYFDRTAVVGFEHDNAVW